MNYKYQNNTNSYGKPIPKYTFNRPSSGIPMNVNNNGYSNHQQSQNFPQIQNNNNINHYKNEEKFDEDLSLIQNLWDDLGIKEEYRNMFVSYSKTLSIDERNEYYKLEKNSLKKFRDNLIKLSKAINNRESEIQKLKKCCDIFSTTFPNPNETLKDSFKKDIIQNIKSIRFHSINTVNYINKIREIISYGQLNNKYDLDRVNKEYKFNKNYLIKMKFDTDFFNQSSLKNYFELQDEEVDTFFSNISTCETPTNPNRMTIPTSNDVISAIKQCQFIIAQDVLFHQPKPKNTNGSYENVPSYGNSNMLNKSNPKIFNRPGVSGFTNVNYMRTGPTNMSQTLSYLKNNNPSSYENMFLKSSKERGTKNNQQFKNKNFNLDNEQENQMNQMNQMNKANGNRIRIERVEINAVTKEDLLKKIDEYEQLRLNPVDDDYLFDRAKQEAEEKAMREEQLRLKKQREEEEKQRKIKEEQERIRKEKEEQERIQKEKEEEERRKREQEELERIQREKELEEQMQREEEERLRKIEEDKIRMQKELEEQQRRKQELEEQNMMENTKKEEEQRLKEEEIERLKALDKEREDKRKVIFEKIKESEENRDKQEAIKRAEEKRRRKEEKRRLEELRRKEEERKRKEEEERKRIEELKRKEEERKKKEEEDRRRREEEERRRKEEEERKKQEEIERRKREEEEKERQAELKRLDILRKKEEDERKRQEEERNREEQRRLQEEERKKREIERMEAERERRRKEEMRKKREEDALNEGRLEQEELRRDEEAKERQGDISLHDEEEDERLKMLFDKNIL